MTIAPYDQEEDIFSLTEFREIDIMPIMSYSTFMIFLFIIATFVVGTYMLGNKTDNGNLGIEALCLKVKMLFQKARHFTH